MSHEQPLDMWDYWRDKEGHVDALETYYSAILSEEPILQHAVLQIKSSILLIESRMRQLAQTD